MTNKPSLQRSRGCAQKINAAYYQAAWEWKWDTEVNETALHASRLVAVMKEYQKRSRMGEALCQVALPWSWTLLQPPGSNITWQQVAVEPDFFFFFRFWSRQIVFLLHCSIFFFLLSNFLEEIKKICLLTRRWLKIISHFVKVQLRRHLKKNNKRRYYYALSTFYFYA